MIGARDLLNHQRALRVVLVDYWPERPLFRHSVDLPLQILVDGTLRLARTGSSAVTADFWAVNDDVKLKHGGPQRLRAAVFHGSSLLCVVDGVGTLRHVKLTYTRERVRHYVAKWLVGGVELSIAFWRRAGR